MPPTKQTPPPPDDPIEDPPEPRGKWDDYADLFADEDEATVASAKARVLAGRIRERDEERKAAKEKEEKEKGAKPKKKVNAYL